jgi:hypothetical protein
MLARTKCLSIALVFGIVSQSLGFSKPATASSPSAVSSRPAAISPLSSPLGAQETLTPTATSDTGSTPEATTIPTDSTVVAASGKTSHLAVQVDFETQTLCKG